MMKNLGRIAATVFGILYTLSPIDAVPDIIPVLGQLDDLGVIVLVVLYWLSQRNQVTSPAAEDENVIDIDPIE